VFFHALYVKGQTLKKDSIYSMHVSEIMKVSGGFEFVLKLQNDQVPHSDFEPLETYWKRIQSR